MSEKVHSYNILTEWTGNRGSGTSSYRAYSRDHEISASGKKPIPGSSDPAFRGDRARYNPEELLVASLSTCHMLWYLHLCSDAGIVVLQYNDPATGQMIETDQGGRFIEVILHPRVRISCDHDKETAHSLHERAHELCFIANSVNFPVRCEPEFVTD